MARRPTKALGGQLTDFARVEVGLMGVPLFRPLPRKDRDEARKKRFEVNTVHDGRHLRIIGATLLGADDLSVLLAVLALSGPDGKRIDLDESAVARVEIRDGLESEGDVEQEKHVRLRTTLHAICREAGIAVNKEAYGRVTESLRRMRGVYYDDLGLVGANSKKLYATGKQNLLSLRARDDVKEIVVVLNARFARVILGPREHHARIDLRESRSLGEMARLIHARLCVRARMGERHRARTDDLVEAIYGEEARSDRERRNRRIEIRAGIAELNALPGWRIEEDRAKLVVTVSRIPPGEQQGEPAEGSATPPRRGRRSSPRPALFPRPRPDLTPART